METKSLSIELSCEKVFVQKTEYISNKPPGDATCVYAEDCHFILLCFIKTEGIILKCNRIGWDQQAGSLLFLMMPLKIYLPEVNIYPALAGGGDGFVILGTVVAEEKCKYCPLT